MQTTSEYHSTRIGTYSKHSLAEREQLCKNLFNLLTMWSCREIIYPNSMNTAELDCPNYNLDICVIKCHWRALYGFEELSVHFAAGLLLGANYLDFTYCQKARTPSVVRIQLTASPLCITQTVSVTQLRGDRYLFWPYIHLMICSWYWRRGNGMGWYLPLNNAGGLGRSIASKWDEWYWSH
jgi:hypothetical protein